MYVHLIRRVRRRSRDERGAIAILTAVSMSLLVVAAGFALDFGLVRVDRQADRSAADSAVLAGLHGLNNGDGIAHPYMGVCTAVQYLQVNNDRFSGINPNAGWTDGLGAATASGCTNAALRKRVCKSTDRSTWAVWHGTGTSNGLTYDIRVQSAYQLGNLTTSPWTEDHLSASSGDTSYQGCDQLAVTIHQSRRPTFGALAISGQLSTNIRSVGRVRLQPGKSAPAMLLLKRTGCPVLSAGNSGGGSGTFIHVLGAYSASSGITQAGTIHADTDGTNCTGGSNQNVFLGLQSNGIVAYAAPLASNPSAPDPSKPGMITSVAALNGAASNIIRDSLSNVHGSGALNAAGSGTQYEVSGRTLVTRGLIDQRYGVGAATSTGVPLAVSQANSVFASFASSTPAGWSTLSSCTPTQAQVDAAAPSSSTWLYINCAGGNGFTGASTGLVIKAGRVFFKGVVNPSGALSMPNATQVYVGNTLAKPDAVNLGNGATFGVNNASSNLTSGICSNGQKPSKATLFLKTGDFKETGGTLQLCRTTVFMMSGSTTGCLPTTSGNAPTSSPCPGINSGLGTGQFTQTGGNIDWTAPDTIDQTLDSKGNPLPTATVAWSDPNGPEDLALWSESATNSSSTYNMNGGGVFHVAGVFMVPNADPFQISGGANMNLTNAQYIVTSIQLSGGTQITMSVDPNSAVTVPDLGLVGLVR